MLPLWIIDLNSDKKRCEHFLDRLNGLKGALFAVSYIPVHQDTGERQNENDQEETVEGQWYYTHFDDPFEQIDHNNEELMAETLYKFKENIVEEGQKFVAYLRKTKVQTQLGINICVLGHIEEELTQMTFASMAALIQLEKGRIMPNHVHQGMNIMGSLFIPSAVNTRKREERQKVLRCLREIEVQHEVSSVHGYDKMHLYQDVQNRTQKAYSQLNIEQQVDYITQCLVNLFYATNKFHPLLSGRNAEEHFYLSLGPASIFYDPTLRDALDRQMVANEVIKGLKADAENNETDNDELVNAQDYDTTRTLFKIFKDLKLNMDLVTVPDPDPHPVKDFMYKPLKRRYYMGYLARYPSILMSKITESVAIQTRETLEKVSIERKKLQDMFVCVTLPNAIRQQLVNCNQNTGALHRIERKVNHLKELLAKKQKSMPESIDFDIWPRIIDTIPEKLSDHFIEYHDEYEEDLETIRHSSQSKADRCESRKKEALADLINHIKHEPTILSRLGRVFLFGICLVLFIMPIIELLSPSIINLGNVVNHAFSWATAVFLLPALWQLISYLIYQRYLKLYVTRLKAYYLHDAYARVVNAMQSETNFFYNKAMQICDEYIKRCDLIRKDVKPITDEPGGWKPDVPEMVFNQPLVDGKFSGKHLFPGEYIDYSKVQVGLYSEYVNKLSSEDVYTIIRVLKDQTYKLFSNVHLPDYHEHTLDETTGRNVFLSVKQMEDLKQQQWQDTMANFKMDLLNNVQRLMVPRKLSTVDSKVLNYTDTYGNTNIMDPVIDFCSTNGELTADDCTEYADVKCNDEKMMRLITKKMPFNTFFQPDVEDPIYKKFFFLTKWRSYDHIAANRILPETELDLSVKDVTTFIPGDSNINSTEADDTNATKRAFNLPYSSIFLYSLCGTGSAASIWMKLFRNEDFADLDEKSQFLGVLQKSSERFNQTLYKLD